MEDDVLQRIKELLKHKGISMLQVSNACGIKQNTFSRQMSGENSFSLSTLLSIIGYFPDVSAEWLLRGDGSMIKGENEAKGESGRKFVVCVDKDGYLKIEE